MKVQYVYTCTHVPEGTYIHVHTYMKVYIHRPRTTCSLHAYTCTCQPHNTDELLKLALLLHATQEIAHRLQTHTEYYIHVYIIIYIHVHGQGAEVLFGNW